MNPNDVNLNHIFNNGTEVDEFNITDLSPRELSEVINDMNDRAASVVELLLPYYEPTAQLEPTSKSVYFALNSILIELRNVQNTVEAYALANRPNSQA